MSKTYKLFERPPNKREWAIADTSTAVIGNKVDNFSSFSEQPSPTGPGAGAANRRPVTTIGDKLTMQKYFKQITWRHRKHSHRVPSNQYRLHGVMSCKQIPNACYCPPHNTDHSQIQQSNLKTWPDYNKTGKNRSRKSSWTYAVWRAYLRRRTPPRGPRPAAARHGAGASQPTSNYG